MPKAKAIPDGYPQLTPYICVDGAERAIEFYKKVFGAKERMRMPSPGGKIGHAELQIGDSVLMLGHEAPERGCFAPASLKGTTGGLYLYVGDVDAAVARASEAGCTVTMPATDMFWGDRVGEVQDPSGHRWDLATHKEDLTPEETARRAQKWYASKDAS